MGESQNDNKAAGAPFGLNVGLGIKIGDRVRTGVYVIGEWKPMWLGMVIDQSDDGSSSKVDIGSMHGCRAIINWEQTSHLRKEPNV